MPRYSSRRYVKAIKEVLNQIQGTNSSVHLDIAEIITHYSHKPLVSHGTYLMNAQLNYFVVEKLLSSHFVSGFFCPPRVFHNGNSYWYQPDILYKTQRLTKKLMDPFTDSPFVKQRKHKFFLTKKYKQAYEPLQTFTHFFG